MSLWWIFAFADGSSNEEKGYSVKLFTLLSLVLNLSKVVWQWCVYKEKKIIAPFQKKKNPMPNNDDVGADQYFKYRISVIDWLAKLHTE